MKNNNNLILKIILRGSCKKRILAKKKKKKAVGIIGKTIGNQPPVTTALFYAYNSCYFAFAFKLWTFG
jgi:hypothetical protein